ncbi:holocytochrome c synthase [Rhizophlyctis rosea]|uniref:Holocytochrome c-type synthase n=1 Tax=Rhizophlyctis rosea TaxID=64517 RepID=A0AAD5S5J5_9FUNG|nr:holocytochrome c synthase [Rhizophlyctis rosea]
MSSSGCPVDHSSFAHLAGKTPAGHPPIPSQSQSSSTSSQSSCPVDHSKFQSNPLNPKNMMPDLAQTPAPGQTVDLSTERSTSSIPRGDDKGRRWEYPSPQQFYNALRRKGWETPENEISTMVDIHNFLNEGCWDEVLRWEKLFHCECEDISLLKFQGRPQDLTPKARVFSWFGVEKPFDRHDWTIDRCGKPVRYVIDYYSAPDEAPGVPAFNVDVRPALDSPGAFWDRSRMAFRETWERFFGGDGAGAEGMH